MKRSLLITLFLLALVGLVAIGYSPESRVEAALQATETPTPVIEEVPAEADALPVAQPEPAAQPDSNCIVCHSDAEQLQLVAEEEEVAESLNEGSG